MRRQMVYSGQIPLETDLLHTNRDVMIALGFFAQAILGTTTCVDGLACTPTSPASMTVNVAPGSIYAVAAVDDASYSSLAADTTHSILKQGLLYDSAAFALTAPATVGYAINYLIQGTFSEVDGGSTVLPYYNSSNPAVAWSGPSNSGAAQHTTRTGTLSLSTKAGTAATSGTQTTPSADAGYVPLWVVTVAYGATSISSGNIVVHPNAPFINPKLFGLLSSITGFVAKAGDTMTGLLAGTAFRAAKGAPANNAAAVGYGFGGDGDTGLFAMTGTGNDDTTELSILFNAVRKMSFRSDGRATVAADPTAAMDVATKQYVDAKGVAGIQFITATGTYTPTAGTVAALVFAQGAGGGGGGPATTGTLGAGGGGGGGALAVALVTSPTSTTVTIGAGGAGSNTAAGSAGGSTSFGTAAVAGGGAGGLVGFNDGTGLFYSSGGVGGTATAGTVQLKGAPGTAAANVAPGTGGAGLFGTGGGVHGMVSPGTPRSPGAGVNGGGGGGAEDSQTGGTGGNGCVLIIEFK
ncbi:hypothetical protein EYW49_22020 [Siculibacillus lacustris]|uniref:Uncharacterized protein n=1 Tax=Siculibacillus lacustris TaxID=1549641 RepID=A0A4Q9VD90_9HYPH|nr:hypothetical protein [Siculibacillus lacustris]TBW32618.1 hypothetical protein EYW49_22020 [Siculibacillus lacustris]